MIDLKDFGVNNNLPDDVDFEWYALGNYKELLSTEYPEFTLDFTVRQLDVTITRIGKGNGIPLSSLPDLMVSFNGMTICLGQDGYYPYAKEYLSTYYAITLHNATGDDGDGVIYLGVQSDS